MNFDNYSLPDNRNQDVNDDFEYEDAAYLPPQLRNKMHKEELHQAKKLKNQRHSNGDQN